MSELRAIPGFYVAHHRWLDAERGPNCVFKVGMTGDLQVRLCDDAYTTCFPEGWRYIATVETATRADAELLETAVLNRAAAQRLDAAGVIWAPVVELPEVVDDPTVRSLGSFVEIEHPQFGSYETLATPFNIRGVDISPRGPAPGLGEHTQSVLEALGLDSEELAELAAAGVFG